MQNQREWFERFAFLHGGDPLDVQFWYSMNPKDFFRFKVYKPCFSASFSSFLVYDFFYIFFVPYSLGDIFEY